MLTWSAFWKKVVPLTSQRSVGVFSAQDFWLFFHFQHCNCVGGAIYSEPQDAHSTKNGTLSITGTTLMSNQGAQYLMQLFSFPCLSLLKTVFRPLSIIVWTRTRMMLIRAAFVNPITNAWQFMEMEAPSHFWKTPMLPCPVSRCTGTLRQILPEVSTWMEMPG